MKKQTIGIIGVGRMGYMMAEYLLNNEYSVLAYDVFEQALERVAGIGAQTAASVTEVGKQCDIILLSLPKPPHVRAVINELMEVVPSGTIIADTSTVDPSSSKENAELLKNCDAYFIDAPILGLPSAVGNWIMLLGGDSKSVEKLTPVLMSFCKQVIPAGEVGSGNAMKLLNNTMFAVINALTAEIMQGADKVGIDKQVFYDAIAGSDAATVSGLFRSSGKRICESAYNEPTFTLDLLLKDITLGVEMMRSAGIFPMISSNVLTINENACRRGFGDQDCSGIYNYMDNIYK